MRKAQAAHPDSVSGAALHLRLPHRDRAHHDTIAPFRLGMEYGLVGKIEHWHVMNNRSPPSREQDVFRPGLLCHVT